MKNKIISFLISIYLILFFTLNILIPDKDISLTERRKLAQLPKLNDFTEKFENYALDQFSFRDNFRSLKANFNFSVMHNLDNNKLVLKDGYIYKMEYPTNTKSINNFYNMINKISGDYKNNKKYIAIIPDKSYYLDNNYLKLDYYNILDKAGYINGVGYIPLNDILTIEDYYKTDTHWIQSNLLKVVNRLTLFMNFDYTTNYKLNTYNNFKGVYYGQLGLNTSLDTLRYLTNNDINNAYVDDLEHPKDNKVYNLDKLDTYEPYDVYLNGSTPIITITNENCINNKELIIFRDSFGSSLAPLLISSYKKITLIDLRYIDYNVLTDYINIDKQDILFLYSTLIINNSNTLKY